ncbi:MAG: ankyrin repeat domain-containing protein [Bacteroidetes bacterium]|nr:ankyrin repeat domain-containing protein [Bacteroidota bacterium]
MKNKMKNVKWLYLLMLLGNIMYGQELNKEQVSAFKEDNVVQFQKSFSDNQINQCFMIKEGSYNPLVISIKLETKNVFKYLLEHGADVNKICDNKTPLMFAAKYGKLEMVKQLLAKGAQKDLKNTKGYTALDYAKRENFQEIVQLLQ